MKTRSLAAWNAAIYVAQIDDARLGEALVLNLEVSKPWSGEIRFDEPRHRTHMHMPMDWPRMNQFPEWFVVEEEAHLEKGVEPDVRAELLAEWDALLTESVLRYGEALPHAHAAANRNPFAITIFVCEFMGYFRDFPVDVHSAVEMRQRIEVMGIGAVLRKNHIGFKVFHDFFHGCAVDFEK